MTGQKTNGWDGRVDLKMLEVYEIECLDPPKQPDIPSEAEIMRLNEERR